MASQRPQYNQGYMSNGAPPHHQQSIPHGAVPLQPNNGRVIEQGGVRVLCVADVRGNLRSLDELAKTARAHHIIHTGDFGFYDDSSLERIAEKTLKHVAQYSPLLSENVKKAISAPGQTASVKQRFPASELPLSELPQFLTGEYKLEVPVYTVWGACEDVRVLEKFRSGEYKVDKLHIIDEARSMLLEVGGVKLRLLGLGGAVVMHKLFDNGEGRTTIAGGQGTMWTTLLQMGELVDTSNRVYDPTETRIFVTHASPAREGILNQLSVALKADFSISAGLHFRYGSSYNEFSVNPTLDHYRGKLAASKASFNDVWETVKNEVQPAIAQNDSQQTLLNYALSIVEKMPATAHGGNPFGGPVGGQNATAQGQVDESAFKNMWNFNLADAAFGYLVLEIENGRIGTEMRAQGFNFAHRGAKPQPPFSQQSSVPAQIPVVGSMTPGPVHNVASAPSQTRSPAAQAQPTQPSGPRPNQQQQPKGPSGTNAPIRNVNSPAPFQGQKPQTPVAAAPVASPAPAPAPTVGEKENEKASTSVVTNGATNGDGTASPAPRNVAPEVFALFFMNVESDEALTAVMTEEDKAKIVKITKTGFPTNRVAHLKTAEDRDAVFANISSEFKTAGDRSKPNVKIFSARGGLHTGRGGSRGGAGNWGSSRGDANAANSTPKEGYKSGGDRGTGASDSEGARGGRGRGRGGARGSERGERGGRGGRGARGGNKEAGGASPSTTAATTTSAVAPAPAAPAPATGGES